jgi:hypothetical protein
VDEFPGDVSELCAGECVSFVDEEGDGVGWRGEGEQKGNEREERRRGEERRGE